MTETAPKRVCPECGFISNTSDLVCPNDSTELQVVPEDPMIGSIVADRYKIEKPLGRGGMSIVYKAHHQFMERSVAIKMLRSELATDENSMKRLQIESKAISALKHPNIVPVYDFGVLDNNIPFLVMEYLEGRDFEDLINREGPLDYSRALPIFISICDGLEHAHSNGIIHRDIKPSNIIMVRERDNEEVPVIVDFGIAKIVDLNGDDLNKLTATGQVFGSPLYMSPEQCSAKRPDARSDVYAMGCVMYQALTGETPLKGKTPVDTMIKHIQDSPRSFFEVLGKNNIPTKVELCVFKALEKDPDHRFSTMAEFSDALKNCMDTGSFQAFVNPEISSTTQVEAVKTFSDQLEAVSDTESKISITGEAPEQIKDAFDLNEQKNEPVAKADSAELSFPEDKRESQDFKKEAVRRYDQHPYDSKYSTIALVAILILAVCALFMFFGGTIGFKSKEKSENPKEVEITKDTKPGAVSEQPVQVQPAVNTNSLKSVQPVSGGVNNTPIETPAPTPQVPEEKTIEPEPKPQPTPVAQYAAPQPVQREEPEPAYGSFAPSVVKEFHWNYDAGLRTELVNPIGISDRDYSGVVLRVEIPKAGRSFNKVVEDSSYQLKNKLESNYTSKIDKVFYSRDRTRWVKKQRLFVNSKAYFILYINKSAGEVQALEFIPVKAQEYATDQLVQEVIRKHIKS